MIPQYAVLVLITGSVMFGEPTTVINQKDLFSGLPSGVSVDWLAQAGGGEKPKPPADYVRIEGEGFTIDFLKRFERNGVHGQAITADAAKQNVLKALKNVESIFGPFGVKLHITPIGEGILPIKADVPEGVVHVQLSLDVLRTPTFFAHEMAHFRVKHGGIELPAPLEESLAMVAERGKDTPHPIAEALKALGGPLKVEGGRILDEPPTQPTLPDNPEDEAAMEKFKEAVQSFLRERQAWQVRFQGTMWLIAHHLANHHTIEEIQKLEPKDYPSADDAWKALKAPAGE